MSLINEALKKAQKQRTGESAPLPSIGGESAERIARRGKPAGFNALVTRIVIGVVAVVAIVAVTIVFLRRPSAEPVATKPAAPLAQTPAPVAQTPAVVQSSVTKPVEVAPQPVVQAPVVAPPQHQNPAPVIVVAQPKPEPIKLEPAPTKTEPVAPVVTTTVVAAPVITVPAAEAARPLAPGKLEPRAITFIEAIRVTGIRASGSDRKVLMNDRVYRLGDLVEPEMGLTLVGIATNALTFQDERGAKYTRNF